MSNIAVLGTVGLPANYGGFETLVENLARYHANTLLSDELTVYCSAKSYPKKLDTFINAKLRYLPLQANGVQSILYDALGLFACCLRRNDVILL